MSPRKRFDHSPERTDDTSAAETNKAYLDLLQHQMQEKKQRNKDHSIKEKELEKKYLQDLIDLNPFGKIGGGAPIKDNFGNVKATRVGMVTNLHEEIPEDQYIKSPNNKYFFNPERIWARSPSPSANPKPNGKTIPDSPQKLHQPEVPPEKIKSEVYSSYTHRDGTRPNINQGNPPNHSYNPHKTLLNSEINNEDWNLMDNHQYFYQQKMHYKQLLENNNKLYLDFLAKASPDSNTFNLKSLNKHYFDTRQNYLDLYDQSKLYKGEIDKLSVIDQKSVKEIENDRYHRVRQEYQDERNGGKGGQNPNGAEPKRKKLDPNNRPYFVDDQKEKEARLLNYQYDLQKQIRQNNEKKEQERLRKQKEDDIEDQKFKRYLFEQEMLKKELQHEKKLKQAKRQKPLKGVTIDADNQNQNQSPRRQGQGQGQGYGGRSGSQPSHLDIIREKRANEEQIALETRIKEYYDRYEPGIGTKKSAKELHAFNYFENKQMDRFDGINRSMTNSLDDQIKFLKSEMNIKAEMDFNEYFQNKVTALKGLDYGTGVGVDKAQALRKKGSHIKIGDSYVEEKASPFKAKDLSLYDQEVFGEENNRTDFGYGGAGSGTGNLLKSSGNQNQNLQNNTLNRAKANPNLQSISEMVYIEDDDESPRNHQPGPGRNPNSGTGLGNPPSSFRQQKDILVQQDFNPNDDQFNMSMNMSISSLAKRGQNLVNDGNNNLGGSSRNPYNESAYSNNDATFDPNFNRQTQKSKSLFFTQPNEKKANPTYDKDATGTDELYDKLNDIINLNSQKDKTSRMKSIKNGFNIDFGIGVNP